MSKIFQARMIVIIDDSSDEEEETPWLSWFTAKPFAAMNKSINSDRNKSTCTVSGEPAMSTSLTTQGECTDNLCNRTCQPVNESSRTILSSPTVQMHKDLAACNSDKSLDNHAAYTSTCSAKVKTSYTSTGSLSTQSKTLKEMCNTDNDQETAENGIASESSNSGHHETQSKRLKEMCNNDQETTDNGIASESSNSGHHETQSKTLKEMCNTDNDQETTENGIASESSNPGHHETQSKRLKEMCNNDQETTENGIASESSNPGHHETQSKRLKEMCNNDQETTDNGIASKSSNPEHHETQSKTLKGICNNNQETADNGIASKSSNPEHHETQSKTLKGICNNDQETADNGIASKLSNPGHHETQSKTLKGICNNDQETIDNGIASESSNPGHHETQSKTLKGICNNDQETIDNGIASESSNPGHHETQSKRLKGICNNDQETIDNGIASESSNPGHHESQSPNFVMDKEEANTIATYDDLKKPGYENVLGSLVDQFYNEQCCNVLDEVCCCGDNTIVNIAMDSVTNNHINVNFKIKIDVDNDLKLGDIVCKAIQTFKLPKALQNLSTERTNQITRKRCRRLDDIDRTCFHGDDATACRDGHSKVIKRTTTEKDESVQVPTALQRLSMELCSPMLKRCRHFDGMDTTCFHGDDSTVCRDGHSKVIKRTKTEKEESVQQNRMANEDISLPVPDKEELFCLSDISREVSQMTVVSSSLESSSNRIGKSAQTANHVHIPSPLMTGRVALQDFMKSTGYFNTLKWPIVFHKNAVFRISKPFLKARQ